MDAPTYSAIVAIVGLKRVAPLRKQLNDPGRLSQPSCEVSFRSRITGEQNGIVVRIIDQRKYIPKEVPNSTFEVTYLPEALSQYLADYSLYYKYESFIAISNLIRIKIALNMDIHKIYRFRNR
jgi:hypothetical protein